MNHVMLDNETLGVTADAPVIQIGAVWFDMDGNLGPELKLTIDMVSACTKRRVDGATVAWWMKQSDEARASVTGGKMKTALALQVLSYFITGQEPHDMSPDVRKAARIAGLPDPYEPPSAEPRIWSVGFNDAVQLESLYRLYRLPLPWAFHAPRDCRTIEEISPISRRDCDTLSGGTHHDALSDAKYQVAWLTQMVRLIRPEYENDDLVDL